MSIATAVKYASESIFDDVEEFDANAIVTDWMDDELMAALLEGQEVILGNLRNWRWHSAGITIEGLTETQANQHVAEMGGSAEMM